MSAVLSASIRQIREMRAADVDAVVFVERSAYEFPWTRNIFLDCLRAGYLCRVADLSDGTIGGFALMSIAADEAHVLNLCVSPTYHRLGIGRAMLDHLVCEARARFVRHTYLEVRQSNKSARQLYRSYGFSKVGVRRDYYPATSGREDATVLALTL